MSAVCQNQPFVDYLTLAGEHKSDINIANQPRRFLAPNKFAWLGKP